MNRLSGLGHSLRPLNFISGQGLELKAPAALPAYRFACLPLPIAFPAYRLLNCS